MKFQVSKKAVGNWIIQGFIAFGIVYLILFFVYWLNEKSTIWIHLSLIIKYIGIGLTLFFVVDVFIGPIYRYMNWSYFIEKDRVIIAKKSVIISTKTEIPLCNIRSVNTTQNFISKKFNIIKVELATLGDVHDIDGLNEENAIFFKDHILSRFGDKADESK
ncbi:PH domain-containing protein [Virgibacillus pantothenticus]|uniref:PH domain-containing protein n=1 Tax=Virgibacillus pantothenticus TaxID=1473 RepID=UPI0009850118|nr:PH domain-containing protein [Virgibacillus pantothenticus]